MVQWGQKHLWDVKFVDGPGTFKNTWFPAIDISLPVGIIESNSIETSMSRFRFPKSTTDFDVSLTFVDDSEHTLINWFTEWINTTILNDGKYVSTLEKSIKLLQIARLNPDKSIQKEYSYWVYPDGILSFSGDSSGDVHQYQVTLVIAG